MAIYNEILTARFGKALTKLFSLKGNVAVKQVSGEIMPVIPLFYGVEGRYLIEENRYATTILLAATVGQTSAARIRNPVGSNIVAVVEKATFANGNTAAQEFDMSIGPAIVDLPTAGAVPPIDPRTKVTSSTLISSLSNASPASLAAVIGRAIILPNTTYEMIWFEDMEIPILPGFALQMQETTVNTGAFVTLIWRERFLEESERT